MSHRITPEEAAGLHVPNIWEQAVESFQEVDEESDVPEPLEVYLTDSMRQAA